MSLVDVIVNWLVSQCRIYIKGVLVYSIIILKYIHVIKVMFLSVEIDVPW